MSARRELTTEDRLYLMHGLVGQAAELLHELGHEEIAAFFYATADKYHPDLAASRDARTLLHDIVVKVREGKA